MYDKINNKVGKSLFLIAITLCILSFSSCKKIDLPNEQAKLLIGHWSIAGTSSTPATGAPDMKDLNDIVFKSNGHYRESQIIINDGSFNVVTRTSKKTGLQAIIVEYSRKSDQSFRISNDTLFLIDEIGLTTWIYTKK